MIATYRLIGALASLLCFVPLVQAQTFQGLGALLGGEDATSEASGVSADGSVVVGWPIGPGGGTRRTQTTGFRWSNGQVSPISAHAYPEYPYGTLAHGISADERFANRPDLTAELRFGIGSSMAARYRLEQAEVQLARAMEESIAAFGAQDVRTLRVIEGIAGLRVEQSRFAEAETDYKRVIDALEANAQRADPLYAKPLGNLGDLYLQQERYPDSERLLQLALAQASLAPFDHAGALSNLAHALHGVEDPDRADQYYREAAAAYRQLFPERSPDLAIIYNNHVLLHEERGEMQQALAMHRESLAMRRKVFRDDHPMVIVPLSNIARLSLKSGDANTALTYAEEGAVIADRVYTEPNRFHPSIHATLADARLATGDDAGAQVSSARAKELLALLPDPPPSVVSWVEEVRDRLCKTEPASCP